MFIGKKKTKPRTELTYKRGLSAEQVTVTGRARLQADRTLGSGRQYGGGQIQFGYPSPAIEDGQRGSGLRLIVY